MGDTEWDVECAPPPPRLSLCGGSEGRDVWDLPCFLLLEGGRGFADQRDWQGLFTVSCSKTKLGRLSMALVTVFGLPSLLLSRSRRRFFVSSLKRG